MAALMALERGKTTMWSVGYSRCDRGYSSSSNKLLKINSIIVGYKDGTIAHAAGLGIGTTVLGQVYFYSCKFGK